MARYLFIAQKFIGEPDISVFIHEVETKTLHEVEIAGMVGDDEFIYPDELASIEWSPDGTLYIEPKTIKIGIISVSSSTPWIVKADI